MRSTFLAAIVGSFVLGGASDALAQEFSQDYRRWTRADCERYGDYCYEGRGARRYGVPDDDEYRWEQRQYCDEQAEDCRQGRKYWRGRDQRY